MDKLKRTGLVIACCMLSVMAMAQPNTNEEPTDFMRSNGKIYVVVAVAVVIMTGLFLYLLSLDRKIKKLEKEI